MEGTVVLRLGFLILTAMLAMSSLARAQNLRIPPTPQQSAYAAKLGWKPAAEQLGKALRAGYTPGKPGLAGAVGSPAFQSWLLLQRWCELLSRDSQDELARYLSHFFVLDDSRGDRLTFLPSGWTMPENAKPVPADTIRRLVDDADSRSTTLARLLPTASVSSRISLTGDVQTATNLQSAETFSPPAGTIADGLKPEFLAAMAGDEAFLRAFFANLSDRDCAPLVLRILQDIWSANPQKWPAYRNLAIALALVRDQKPPAWWPHDQVQPSKVPANTATPVEEFNFWVASNESQRLYTDLRRLDPEQLKFVVDAPVAQSELEWAQKNARFPRGDFGRAFSSINYRYDRLSSGALSWNEGPYTLEAIRDRGGICVDQAYFAMLAGKGRGLPTLFFTGQGKDGGHAWFGYLKNESRWDMDCGRYVNQNYAVGEALDPQTWLPINDHELASLAESFRRTPAYLASQADLAMAQLFQNAGDNARALAAIDSAIGICPQNDLAWQAKGELLDATHASVAAQRAFHEAALKQFVNNGDIKIVHQRALAGLARTAGNEAEAQQIEAQIISQNRRTRSDLSVGVGADRLFALVKAGKYDDAMTAYRDLLGRIGRTSGGNFYYEIVSPFARALAQSGDRAGAKRSLELARNALRPEAGSILDSDLRSLEKEFAAASSKASGR
jgi:tetratricopeptide (TPR) repeat protein